MGTSPAVSAGPVVTEILRLRLQVRRDPLTAPSSRGCVLACGPGWREGPYVELPPQAPGAEPEKPGQELGREMWRIQVDEEGGAKMAA